MIFTVTDIFQKDCEEIFAHKKIATIFIKIVYNKFMIKSKAFLPLQKGEYFCWKIKIFYKEYSVRGIISEFPRKDTYTPLFLVHRSHKSLWNIVLEIKPVRDYICKREDDCKLQIANKQFYEIP